MKQLIGMLLVAATVLPTMHAASSSTSHMLLEQKEWPFGDEAIVFAMKQGPEGSIFTDLRANGVSTDILRKLHDDMANSSDNNSVMGLGAVVEIAAQRNKIKAEAMAQADTALKDALAGLQRHADVKERQQIAKLERAEIATGAAVTTLVVGGLSLAGMGIYMVGLPVFKGATFVTINSAFVQFTIAHTAATGCTYTMSTAQFISWAAAGATGLFTSIGAPLLTSLVPEIREKRAAKIRAIQQQFAVQQGTVEEFQRTLNNISNDRAGITIEQ